MTISNITTNGTSSTSLSSNDLAKHSVDSLLPVKLLTPTKASHIAIQIQNQTFQIIKTDIQAQLLQSGSQLAITKDQAAQLFSNMALLKKDETKPDKNSKAATKQDVRSNASSVSIETKVVLIGKPIEVPVPAALQQLAKQNNVSTTQLNQLASRPQGYPLPNAIINNGTMTFDHGPKIQLENAIKVPAGNYAAHITLKNQKLALVLTPMTNDVSITLQPKSTVQPEANSIVLSKKEPVEALQTLFRSLNQTPIKDQFTVLNPTLVANTELSVKQAEKKSAEPTSIDVLSKAFSKAGALPKEAPVTTNTLQSLASEIKKLLPQLDASPLNTLANPAVLQQELHSLAALNLAQTATHLNLSNTADVLTALFQILLGGKATAKPQGISEKLQQHIQQITVNLMLKSVGLDKLLSQLQSTAILDSLSQLANSFAVYQQASTQESNPMLTWYFAMPYCVGQRQEQFEGKFEKSEVENEPGWKLQLKFNLTQGTLLLQANKKTDVVNLLIKADNQELINRIDASADKLKNKLEQVGIPTGNISTTLATIPSTLLPGDHYLVKTQA